jgi:hypothetical protein
MTTLKAFPVVLLWILTLAQYQGMAQSSTLASAENEISLLFTHFASTPADSAKKQINDSIVAAFRKTLSIDGSFSCPFARLTKMGKIASEDGRIRIYTWNLPWEDGTNTYYGFLQYKGSDKQYKSVFLNDQSKAISDPEKQALPPDQWFGMLVYAIIETKGENGNYYTLLGLDNENLFLSRKIVDVLYFQNDDIPVFGKPIFHYQSKMLNRVLFEYSAKVKMGLKWNPKLKMIVFDHLAPSNSQYTGNHAYYGPDLSFDAFKFENGIWELVEKVDARE